MDNASKTQIIIIHFLKYLLYIRSEYASFLGLLKIFIGNTDVHASAPCGAITISSFLQTHVYMPGLKGLSKMRDHTKIRDKFGNSKQTKCTAL